MDRAAGHRRTTFRHYGGVGWRSRLRAQPSRHDGDRTVELLSVRPEMELSMHVNPYLTFNGDCETAIKFYQQTLGGEITMMMTHAGTPMEAHVPKEWQGKIMHASLKIGDTVLMGSDAPPERYEKPKGVSVCLALTDTGEAER